MWLVATLGLLLSTPSGAQAKKLAEQAATEAIKHHAAGRHRQAAEAFLRAYGLSGVHVQLRNAAKAYSEAGDADRAIPLWRKFLDHPDASAADRAEANRFVAKLVETLVTPEPNDLATPAVSPPAPPPALGVPGLETTSPTEARGNSTAWWIVGGLSVASALVGGVLYASARARLRDFDEDLANARTNPGGDLTADQAHDRFSTIRRDHAVSGSLLAVGGAGLITSTLGLTLKW